MKPDSLTFPKLVISTIALVSLVFFLSFKWVNKQWIYNIASDGKGYYVYLPAAFIYHDFSYKFTKQTEAKNYAGDVQPSVTTLANGQKLNKYFVGEAVLLLPFFLLACLISYACHLPVDGYSFVFQASLSVAAIVYALIGLWQLHKLLKHFHIGDYNIGFVLLLVFGGSNLLHYTWMEPSMSHVYSFFAITTLLAVTADYIMQPKTKSLFLIFTLLGIICILRPVNILIVLTFPFLFYMLKKQYTSEYFFNKKSWFLASLIFFGIVFIQLLMYFLQLGQWWVWAYANEGFNFFEPHFFEFLFSFRKGWFIYTPIAFLSMVMSFVVLKDKPRLLFSFLIPLVIIVFVASSWHDWVYGASFGSRPMTEFMGFAIIPFAIALHRLNSYKAKAFIVFAAWCFMWLNCIQTYQINKYILLWDNMTFEKYKTTFLRTHESWEHLID